MEVRRMSSPQTQIDTPIDSSKWLKSREEKEVLVANFMNIYESDLAGRIDRKAYPDLESRVAEKHTALSVIRTLTDLDQIWVKRDI